jgi:predicted outer membrane protein
MTPEKSMAHMMQMMTTISQQMAENCIALTESELSQVDKDQFDRAFIGQQICSHIATLAKLKTLEPYAPVELKSYIESAEKVTRAHLDQAKNICKQWDSKSSASTNRGSY